MSEQLKTQEIGQGITFRWVQDPKFKHNRMSVNFILPLEEDTVTSYALLPFLLRKGYADCPDFTRLNQRLEELYGAFLSGDVSKYGSYQVLDLTIQALDNRFTLDNEDLIGSCAALLAGLACTPNLSNGAFPQEDVKLEKQFLRDTIEAEINDKRSYALNRCRSIMCKGEPIAIKKYGYLDRVDAITPESAAQAYAQVLDRAAIEILFVGSGDPAAARQIFAEAFGKLERHPIAHGVTVTRKTAEKPRETVERLDLVQAKLVLGMRTGELENTAQLTAAWLMTALYGGTPSSKLFLNVREKMSLCYYCAARFDRLTGILMVDCGIEQANREKAQAEILNQLELIRQGQVTEEELRSTKLALKNNLRTVSDSLEGIDNWYMTQIMNQTGRSPEEEERLIDAVTIEDVVAAANKVTLDTVYLLTGKEELSK